MPAVMTGVRAALAAATPTMTLGLTAYVPEPEPECCTFSPMRIPVHRIAIAMLAISAASALILANPAHAAEAAKPIAVITGGHHTCAILDGGSVKCWGLNGNGELGYGDTTSRGVNASEMGDDLPTVDLGTGRTALALTSGRDHTCALLDNHTVKCWGLNEIGELGYGDTDNRGDNASEMGDNLPTVDLGTGRTAKAINAGMWHTCAILDNDTVKCWGKNDHGELGLGDTSHRGDNASEMGDNLPTVDLGTGRIAKVMSSAGVHSCVLLDNNTIKCWGYNGNADLGLGDTDNRGDNSSEMGDSLPAVDLGTGRTAKAVSSGGGGTCSILDNDTVKCWGYSAQGQLGYGDTNNRGDVGGEMGDNLLAVDLGTGRTASAIWYGDLHVCALLDNGSVKCWGWNSVGQLGLGDTDNRGDSGAELGDSLGIVPLGAGRNALSITAAWDHSCALLDNDTIKCWGNNAEGELGQGDANSRGDGPDELGDNLPAVLLGTAPVSLPPTGADTTVLVGLAVILLAAGTVLVTTRRRVATVK
ncbi:MAG: hypothetical protein F2700_08855 [Actinobacteria bacterium]|nr:hypothetical protein [Actinomycetota bacterium]